MPDQSRLRRPLFINSLAWSFKILPFIGSTRRITLSKPYYLLPELRLPLVNLHELALNVWFSRRLVVLQATKSKKVLVSFFCLANIKNLAY